MNVKIVKHYSIEDPEFYGDYGSIQIFINGDLAIEYGDYYHDKGQEKVDGFLDALRFLSKKEKIIGLINVEKEEIADEDW